MKNLVCKIMSIMLAVTIVSASAGVDVKAAGWGSSSIASEKIEVETNESFERNGLTNPNQKFTSQSAKRLADNILLVDTTEEFIDALTKINKEQGTYIYSNYDMSSAVKEYAPLVESSSAGFLASMDGKYKGKYVYYVGPELYNSSKKFSRAEFLQNEKIIDQWINNSGAKSKTTDLEKIKALAVYIKNNSCYDVGSNWGDASNIYSVTRRRKAKCYGYASLTHRALLKLGIKNYALMNTNRTHIANRALVDGKWMSIDLTPFNTTLLNNYYNMGNVGIFNTRKELAIGFNANLENYLTHTDIKVFDAVLGI